MLGKVFDRFVEKNPIAAMVRGTLRDGDRVLCLLTDLPLRKASAKRVAWLCRQHWTLETACQPRAAHFHSEIHTLGSPKAALFGFLTAPASVEKIIDKIAAFV